MRYFLIIFEPTEERLVEMREFSDAMDAEEAYSQLEAEKRGQGETAQVLLFGSRSREALERTHPHYFRRAETTGDTLDFLPV